MKRLALLAGFLLVGVLMSSPAAGGPFGEAGLGFGGIFPQGDFAQYSDPGPAFLLRVNTHIPKVETFSGWFCLGVNLFSSDESELVIDVDGYPLLAKKNIDEYGITLHAGLQLGSASRRGFFRPRAALAPGLYYFNTETSIRPLDYDEDLIEANNGQLRFGWKAVLGADFFFSPKWGVSAVFVYDQVVNLHRDIEIDEAGNTKPISRSARFQGFMIGVVIPFETMDDWD